MAKELKTNVMRILEQAKIPYKPYYYENKDGKIDGISVANKLGQDVGQVFKTLVARGASGNYLVFVIPVAKELNLKAAAKSRRKIRRNDTRKRYKQSHRLYTRRMLARRHEKAVRYSHRLKLRKPRRHHSKRRQDRHAG